MNGRLLGLAAVALAVFLIWTAVVRVGISEGSRRSVWRTQEFGQWPSRFGEVTGSSDARFSLYVSVDQALKTTQLGLVQAGARRDTSDSDNMNGTRVKTGKQAGQVSSISAYVAGPVQAAPNNQFEMAIYTDRLGAPDKLIAKTEIGVLTADTWNTLPLSGMLQPNQPYWLLYNTPASNADVNNLTYKFAAPDPIDGFIHAHKSELLDDFAFAVGRLGNVAPTSLVMLACCIGIGVQRPRRAVALLAIFGGGLVLELILKETVFYPYQQYPSGHTMRAVLLAVAFAHLMPGRFVDALGVALVFVVGFSVIYTGGHYADEVLGGLLLAVGLTLAAIGLTFGPGTPMLSAREPVPARYHYSDAGEVD